MSEDTPPMEHILRQPLVGVDTQGSEHYFDRYRDTVFVIDTDDEIEHVEELAPGQLGEWVDHVAEQRGWQDCRYVADGGFERMVERLSVQLQGER